MFWTADRIYSQGIEQAQRRIYEFFLDAVRRKHPDEVLEDFKNLFVHFSDSQDSEVSGALDQILTSYNEKEFFYTLKRCCYILINNWTVGNNGVYIQGLIDIFKHTSIYKNPVSNKLKTLRIWLQLFVKCEDFKEFELFILHVENRSNLEQHWSNRFASYLLAYQYTNRESSLEQRHAANLLAEKMKEKFKFDLAMYTARLNPQLPQQNHPNNPTSLSDNVLHLVTQMLTKKSVFNCKKLANEFLISTKNVSFYEYKTKLLKYLDFSIADSEISKTVQTKIYDGLYHLKAERHEYSVNSAMILRTSKYIIGEITSSDRGQPTELFNILLHHTNPLNFVVLLLKILLLNDSVRPYLELRVASIIKYYSQFSESKCKSVISFIDMLNISFAVYAGGTHYNIVRMNPYQSSNAKGNHSDSEITKFDARDYRIFSQAR